jgi:hypothetical protein
VTQSIAHYPVREYWRPIPGYPGYAVSSHGRVVSAIRSGQLLKLWTRNGYASVQLGAGNPILYVHRLVTEAFHGPAPTEKHEAAHWDGNPANNLAANLRWATHSENQLDSVRHGTHYWANRGRARKAA